MFFTVILLSLLLVSCVVSRQKNYTGPHSFDKATTLPLRGLLALLIVSHHLGQSTEIHLISRIAAGIGAQIVAVFFFISGYGLCSSYLAKGTGYLDGFLNKRMGKLLPMFILLTVAMIFARYYFMSSDFESQLSNFAAGLPPLPNSWFIYAIIYVYIAFFLCTKLTVEPHKLGGLFTLSTIIYMGVTYKIFHFEQYWFITIILVNVGYFVALYERKISFYMSTYRIAFYAAATTALTISCILAKFFLNTPYLALFWLECWLISLTFAVYAVVRTMSFVQWKWLCQIGIFSFELYLIHGIPLLIGRHIGFENWALWIFTYALSIPAAIALNRVSGLLSKVNRRPQLNG